MITVEQLIQLNKLMIRYQKLIIDNIVNAKSNDEAINIPELTKFLDTLQVGN